jgi:hypothetical protein
MTPYALADLSLALALVVQCIAAGIMTQTALRPPYRRAAMILAIGFGLLALHHAFTLELALHSGLFDLRQSLLAAGGSLLLLLGLSGFNR